MGRTLEMVGIVIFAKPPAGNFHKRNGHEVENWISRFMETEKDENKIHSNLKRKKIKQFYAAQP